ncbi:MAG: transporter substrate-binding domain-containing protein [Bacillota bacterium]
MQTIKDRGVLVVGLDDSYPPMGYRDDKNQLIGFDIDMGNEIGKRMGVKVEWQPTDWDGVIASLQSKKFDIIISGMTVTPERQQAVNFTNAYVTAGVVMLVKEEYDSLKNQKTWQVRLLVPREAAVESRWLEKLKASRSLNYTSSFRKPWLIWKLAGQKLLLLT